MREMNQFDADIYCLQEVQADRFENFFYPEMRTKGYEGLYKKKTRESMGQEGKVDGCAIFFKRSRFHLLEKYVIEFNDAAMAMARAGTLTSKQKATKTEVCDALNRLLKDNVAQVVVLETLPSEMEEGGQRFCVCNTHIFWDPEYSDVKLWQTHMLIKELEKFNVGRNLPLILCGDFNSMPDSSVYEFLTTGSVRAVHPDLKRNPCGITPAASEFRHDLQLQSAFVSTLGSEPQFTNFTGDFVGTLDYLFSTTDRLQAAAVHAVPTEEVLRKQSDSPLPNPQYPSDHIALCADFHFVDKGQGNGLHGHGGMGNGMGGGRSGQQAPSFRGLGAHGHSMGHHSLGGHAHPSAVSRHLHQHGNGSLHQGHLHHGLGVSNNWSMGQDSSDRHGDWHS